MMTGSFVMLVERNTKSGKAGLCEGLVKELEE